MGKRTSTTTQTNKPIYGAQIEGAANTLSNTYAQQAPKIADTADQFLGASGGLLQRAMDGNPAVNSARDWITSTLGQDNPHLQQQIDRTNKDVVAGTAAGLGTRGLNGGSVATRVLADRIAANENTLRNGDRAFQAQAAGMAPSIAAGEFLGYAPALATAQFGTQAPMQAAAMNAAGVGGLLGAYQNTTGTAKQSGGFGDLLGGLLGAGLSGWATGGFKL